MVFPTNNENAMAQQTTATDADDAQTETDPELAASNHAEAVDSLQVHMTRSEMRDAARSWDTRSSGTKQEMADAMLNEAREQALGFLAEEGVALTGELADNQADDEEGEADGDPQGSLAGDLLARSPDDYGYTAKLRMTEKQTAAVVAALENPDATQAEVAEAAGCTPRYANSTLNRWRGTQDEVQAMQDEGVEVPAEFMQHEVAV
jgi:hypothetical protein